MSQRLILTETSPRLDFETQIDWQERRTLLKVAFPLALLSSSATYEIQWGNVERPTHQNTSWDWARFESCAHKWVDLSEADYGVSLLNDCKYGYDIHDNVLRMTVLKGAMFPDPTADLGEHRFTYSLLPHSGTWREWSALQAYGLNDPLLVRKREHPTRFLNLAAGSMILVDVPQIILETVKVAEQGDDIVVRMYEFHRTRGTLTLTTSFEIAAAWMCDLHETEHRALIPDGNKLTLPFAPYEIITVRIRPAGKATRKDIM
jgi:alpha-mannosidase